jgi:uncharacterized protein (TIGR02266 family)
MSDNKKNGSSWQFTRKYRRAALSLMVRVKVGEGIFKAYQSKNLSAGGVFILSEFPLEEETQVSLELFLPQTDEPLKLQGEVVWQQRQDPAGFAVKFTGITEGDRSRIRQSIPDTQPDK